MKKEEKRRAIVKAAMDLLAERGIENVSTGDIAARARVGKGTMYIYFPSKEDLLREVALSVYESFVRDVEAATESSEDPRSFISRLSERVFSDLDRRGRLIHMLRGYLRGEGYERLVSEYRSALEKAHRKFRMGISFEELYFYTTSLMMSSYVFRDMGLDKLREYFKKGLEKLILGGRT